VSNARVSKKGAEPRELELKFGLTGEQYDRLRNRLVSAKFQVSPVKTEDLRSIYFDTADWSLRNHGMSLRLRTSGDKWLQTLKSGVGVKSGVSNPHEIEVPVRYSRIDIDAIPDGELKKKLCSAINGAALRPIFETEVQRLQRSIEIPGGDTMLLGLDRGTVKAIGNTKPICEAELELVKGSPLALLDVADVLLGNENIEPSTRSKSELGFSLLEPETEPALLPVKAVPASLDRHDTAGEALEKIVLSAVDQILANIRVVRDTDAPEAVHQLRVGMRRLRSGLKLFKPVFDLKALQPIVAEIRELARRAGKLRDVQVMLHDMIDPLDAAHESPVALNPLRAALRAKAGRLLQDFRAHIADAATARLERQLALLAAIIRFEAGRNRKLAKPATKLARKAMKKAWKKVKRNGNAIATLSVEERHELRKDLKTLRYATEFLAPLFTNQDPKKLSARLSELQDVLGHLNDIAASAAMTAAPEYAPDAQRSLAYVTGWHTAHSPETLRQAERLWKKIKSADRFWE
jgi:inorganic triphosphatase YgiF